MAGIGSRFLALAVDSLIQVGAGIAMLIILGILGWSTRNLGWRGETLWLTAALGFIAFLLMFGYFAIFEILWKYGPDARKAGGANLRGERNRPATHAVGNRRTQSAANCGSTSLVLRGRDAGGSIEREEQAAGRFHCGFGCGARIVDQGHQAGLAHVAPLAADVPAKGVRNSTEALTIEELALIDAFLHRRYDLAPDVRSRMAGEILVRMQPKIALDAQASLSTESLLEALAYERRSSGSY